MLSPAQAGILTTSTEMTGGSSVGHPNERLHAECAEIDPRQKIAGGSFPRRSSQHVQLQEPRIHDMAEEEASWPRGAAAGPIGSSAFRAAPQLGICSPPSVGHCPRSPPGRFSRDKAPTGYVLICKRSFVREIGSQDDGSGEAPRCAVCKLGTQGSWRRDSVLPVMSSRVPRPRNQELQCLAGEDGRPGRGREDSLLLCLFVLWDPQCPVGSSVSRATPGRVGRAGLSHSVY